MKVIVNNEEMEINKLKQDHDGVEFELNGKSYNFTTQNLEGITGALSQDRKQGHLFIEGRDYFISSANNKRSSSHHDEGSMMSPMPGKIFKVLKAVGDSVHKGETILIMEAMKMEHPVKATSDGIIDNIFYAEGAQVDGGVELVTLSGE